MSYARWGEGDVYVFGTGSKYICMCCSTMPMRAVTPGGLFEGFGTFSMKDDFECDTKEEMLGHLNQHIEMDEVVPDYAIERLKEEIKNDKKPNI